MLVVADGACTSTGVGQGQRWPMDAPAAAPGGVEALTEDWGTGAGQDAGEPPGKDAGPPPMSLRELADAVASVFMILFACLLISLALTPMLALYVDTRAVTRDLEWTDANPLAETMMCHSDAVCVDRGAIHLYRVIVYLYLASLVGVVLGTVPMWYLM